MAIVRDRYGVRNTNDTDKLMEENIKDFMENMSIEYTKQLATTMVDNRDKLIEKAITHVLGDGWCITDITDRAAFVVLPDKTEIFTFDGINLIHFYHLRTEIDSNDTIGFNMHAVQDYKLLYE